MMFSVLWAAEGYGAVGGTLAVGALIPDLQAQASEEGALFHFSPSYFWH